MFVSCFLSQGIEVTRSPDATHTSINFTLVTQQPLTQLANDITGEHIADYTCADTFKWGIDWKGNDDGAQCLDRRQAEQDQAE